MNYPFIQEIEKQDLAEGDIIYIPDFKEKGNEVLAVNLTHNYLLFTDAYPDTDYGRVSFYRVADQKEDEKANLFEGAKYYRYISK